MIKQTIIFAGILLLDICYAGAQQSMINPGFHDVAMLQLSKPALTNSPTPGLLLPDLNVGNIGRRIATIPMEDESSTGKINYDTHERNHGTILYCWQQIIAFARPHLFIKNQQEKLLDLYLLIGQSNMAGRGALEDTYMGKGNAHVLMLDKANDWVVAKHPLHFDKPKVAGVGPGLAFGIALASTGKNIKIGLIPCAVGGTSIDVWQPGGYDKATDTHPYDDMLLRLNEALKSGRLKGVIWLQGESDSSPEKAATYLVKLETLINRIRDIVKNRSLPFVAGELGQFKDQYQLINDQLARLPASLAHTGIVSSEGLVDKGDQTHFDSKSATEYGQRFANKMIELMKQGNK